MKNKLLAAQLQPRPFKTNPSLPVKLRSFKTNSFSAASESRVLSKQDYTNLKFAQSEMLNRTRKQILWRCRTIVKSFDQEAGALGRMGGDRRDSSGVFSRGDGCKIP
jgi:hypothetical protein